MEIDPVFVQVNILLTMAVPMSAKPVLQENEIVIPGKILLSRVLNAPLAIVGREHFSTANKKEALENLKNEQKLIW